MTKAEFAACVKADAIKWIEENVKDDTTAILVATDRCREWWAFTPHTFDQSAMRNLLGQVKIAAGLMTDRLVEWAEGIAEQMQKESGR